MERGEERPKRKRGWRKERPGRSQEEEKEVRRVIKMDYCGKKNTELSCKGDRLVARRQGRKGEALLCFFILGKAGEKERKTQLFFIFIIHRIAWPLVKSLVVLWIPVQFFSVIQLYCSRISADLLRYERGLAPPVQIFLCDRVVLESIFHRTRAIQLEGWKKIGRAVQFFSAIQSFQSRLATLRQQNDY